MSESIASSTELAGTDRLVEVLQRLSLATELSAVVDEVRHAARALAGADGATFVLREADLCHYVDEDAIEPLWRGQRFPIDRCISGWAMTHGEHVVLEDIYDDPRIPFDAYRPTFVKSLLMMPIRRDRPIGAIGVYWARRHRATEREIGLLQTLAHSTSVALTNVDLVRSLRESLEETRRSRDELARQLRLRDDFVSLASHELRTPLTPLFVQMHVIRDAIGKNEANVGSSSERVKRALDVSENQLDDLAGLAERLLDVSRIALGNLGIHRHDSVDLGAVARAAIESVRMPSGVKVATRIAERITGRWDEKRLVDVARSLVDNAVKFGADAPISVEVEGDSANAFLRVRDSGLGIAEGDRESIFERFGRVAATTSYRGLGLGLYVARAVVEAHGGTIDVDSRIGEGSTFTVRLPRA